MLCWTALQQDKSRSEFHTLNLPELLCQPLLEGGGVFFAMKKLWPDEGFIIDWTLYPGHQLWVRILPNCSFFLLHSRGSRTRHIECTFPQCCLSLLLLLLCHCPDWCVFIPLITPTLKNVYWHFLFLLRGTEKTRQILFQHCFFFWFWVLNDNSERW